MSVWGISLVKDEADIIGYTLPRMAAQLDGVLIADNLSSDATPMIIGQVAARCGNIELLQDCEVAYLQSEKMTNLAWHARARGAEWVVPFDADEVWYSDFGLLREILPRFEGFAVAEAGLYDHVAGFDDDPAELDPVLRMGRRRLKPGALPKVACRTLPGLVIEQGNHGARYPGAVKRSSRALVVRHYPYRTSVQMARKARNGARAYAAAGDRLPPTAGQHWRDYGRLLEGGGEEAIAEIFWTWFYVPDAADETTMYDPCPVPMPW